MRVRALSGSSVVQELLGVPLNLATPWEIAKLTPASLVIDVKALHDMLKQEDLTNPSAQEKHTALEVMGLSQVRTRNNIALGELLPTVGGWHDEDLCG